MMTNEQKIRILRLHAMGMGYAAIGKEMGIKRDTIKSFISRNKNALLTTRCDFCGRKIVQVPKQKPKRFYSDQCRMKWWSSHQEEINRPLKGAKMEVNGSRGRLDRKLQKRNP